eukprot:scaffold105107_cov25-Tisochrysis_lutea.AAC.2
MAEMLPMEWAAAPDGCRCLELAVQRVGRLPAPRQMEKNGQRCSRHGLARRSRAGVPSAGPCGSRMSQSPQLQKPT